MTWTYTPADLATSSKDQLRLMIGDTVAADPQLQDEELAYFIGQAVSLYGAAALACRSLATQYSRSCDLATGNTKSTYSQMAKAYSGRAAVFESKAAQTGSGMPYAGGISVTDKMNQNADNDRVQPQFQIGMEDNYLPVAPDDHETIEQPETI